MTRELAVWGAISTVFFLSSAVRSYIAITFLQLSSLLSTILLIQAVRHARKWRGTGDAVRKLLPLLSLIPLFAIPAAVVLLLGEAESPYWYVVYVGYLPGALLVSAHAALALAIGTLAPPSPPPFIAAVTALLGSTGGLALFTWWFSQNPPYFFLGAALLLVGLVADMSLFVSARRFLRR